MRLSQTGLCKKPRKLNGLFVVPVVLLVLVVPLGADEPDDLAYLGIKELQKRMESGSLTAVELVSFHVRRIAEIDRSGIGLDDQLEGFQGLQRNTT